MSFQLSSEQSVGDVWIAQLDWKRVPQARSSGCKSSVAVTANCWVLVAPRKSERQLSSKRAQSALGHDRGSNHLPSREAPPGEPDMQLWLFKAFEPDTLSDVLAGGRYRRRQTNKLAITSQFLHHAHHCFSFIAVIRSRRREGQNRLFISFIHLLKTGNTAHRQTHTNVKTVRDGLDLNPTAGIFLIDVYSTSSLYCHSLVGAVTCSLWLCKYVTSIQRQLLKSIWTSDVCI